MARAPTLKVPDEQMFKTFEGPTGVVRTCKCCKHFELVRKGLGAWAGATDLSKATRHAVG